MTITEIDRKNIKIDKILITGITGFVGSHLADYIIENHPEAEIFGLTRWRSPKNNIEHILDKITLLCGDIIDPHSLRSILTEHRPDIIFHLAAQSYVPFSYKVPIATLNANVIGTANLLEEIKSLKLSSGYDPIVHICSSSEVYGQVKEEEVPIKETNPFRPSSPYAVSKVGEDMLALQYWLSWNIKTIRTRMFTHCVIGDTPVFTRKNEIIDISPIGDIVPHRTDPKYPIYSTDITSDNMFDVWDSEGWTKVRHMQATWNGYKDRRKNKPVYRIVARGALFEVTGDHIVYTMNKNNDITECWDEDNSRKEIIEEKPAWQIDMQLKKGDSLALIQLPEPTNVISMTEEEAFLLGLIVSEGNIHENFYIRIANKDLEVVDKIDKTWYQLTGEDTTKYKYDDVYAVTLLNSANYGRYLYDSIYTKNRFKRIPKRILNSSKNVRLAFLKGYNIGDGTKSHSKYDFQEFTTNSMTLASGLYWLTLNTLNQRCTLYDTIRNGETYYKISINAPEDEKSGNGPIQPLEEIIRTRLVEHRNWLFDFTTDSGTFNAGIGQGWIHNSGPRRGEVFATSTFAKQIAAIEFGKQSPIVKVGNLDSIRTFLDVKDAVRAYWILVSRCIFGEVYNVGGNETMTVGEMLNKLINLSTVKDIKIEIDPARLRPSDVTLQIPDISKFTKETGWKPEIKFDKTLEDLLNYWRDYYTKKRTNY